MIKDVVNEIISKPSIFADPIVYFTKVPNEVQKIVPYSKYKNAVLSLAEQEKKYNLIDYINQYDIESESVESDDQYIKNHPSYRYAESVVNGDIIAGKYIIKACQKFLNDLDSDKYFLDINEVRKITNLTKIINMATGLSEGKAVYDSLAGFQWFFIINALCWKHKNNPIKRRYEKSVLLISRKNGKSFLVGVLFIIMLLIEPEFSEFYSVAPDRELSSIVKKEVEQAISKSPILAKHFEITRQEIRCDLSLSKFIPLACSENRLDGRKATAFVADEVGALRNEYPISAMQSSQMGMINRTGILISTAYESLTNPMTEEVNYAERVLDETIEDDTLFALLYKPDNVKDWTSDHSLFEANPLAIDIPENLDYLKQQRQRAIDITATKKNFLTKHMNIFVDGADAEVYVNSDDLKKCKIDSYDWCSKEVYVGLDLSQTSDNTAVSMATYDAQLQKYVVKSWVFYPSAKESEKTKSERLDYRLMTEKGYSFATGDRIIDYSFVEDFILNLESEYGVTIKSVAYDRWNAISTAKKLENNGLQCVEIRQHSSELHPATKLLKESILTGRFAYEKNPLLEINFANAREVYDTNLNSYVNKRKSSGKIDIVASIVNTFSMFYNDEITPDENYDSWVIDL